MGDPLLLPRRPLSYTPIPAKYLLDYQNICVTKLSRYLFLQVLNGILCSLVSVSACLLSVKLFE